MIDQHPRRVINVKVVVYWGGGNVECVKRNLSRLVGIIYRARHILGTENLLTLYYSLFLPIQYLVTVVTFGESLLPYTVLIYCRRERLD